MKLNLTLLFVLATLLSFVSCDKKDLYEGEIDKEVYTPTDFKMTKSYEVIVPAGKVKEVYIEDELVFSGAGSLTIEVPQTFTATRSMSEYEFDDADKGNSGWTYALKRGMLLFEDITDGDNDYNDFVCNISEKLELKFDKDKIYFDNVKYNVSIDPIAMGNILPLQFGVELIINGALEKDIILADDVRTLFFDGVDGYLNTVKGEAAVKGTKQELKDYKANGSFKNNSFVQTNYYIVVNGEKRYTCDSHKAVLTDNGVPFGLYVPFTMTKGFKYAQEFESFFEAYPNFMEWVKSKEYKNPFLNPNESLLY